MYCRVKRCEDDKVVTQMLQGEACCFVLFVILCVDVMFHCLLSMMRVISYPCLKCLCFSVELLVYD